MPELSSLLKAILGNSPGAIGARAGTKIRNKSRQLYQDAMDPGPLPNVPTPWRWDTQREFLGLRGNPGPPQVRWYGENTGDVINTWDPTGISGRRIPQQEQTQDAINLALRGYRRNWDY